MNIPIKFYAYGQLLAIKHEQYPISNHTIYQHTKDLAMAYHLSELDITYSLTPLND